MTNISLREYVHDVENLLARGKAEYAEQHCKHILHYYPKDVKVYRLLGKSCLVVDKHVEAGDIFLRTLSVIPDDFSSLVGLGIIAEDAGDLDSAVWYMELAGEVDASDTDIRSEIRRLYTKRDGVAPERSRITRGGLIRTYLRGELFDQAISNARTALVEEPNRIDYQLLLARAYYQSGRKMEAAETGTQIINKLPYCLEVNKILFIICNSINRPAESQIFQQRISEIEPYSAFISNTFPTPAQVPEDTILLERLDVPLKEEELFLHDGKEPAAELIKILYSPQQSKDREQVENTFAVKSTEKTDKPSDKQVLTEKEITSPNPEELARPDTPENTIDQQPPDDKIQNDENTVEQGDQTDMEGTNLPDWLQGYSFTSKSGRDYQQETETNRDFMDFLYKGKSKFPTKPAVQQTDPPKVDKLSTDQEQLKNWENSLNSTVPEKTQNPDFQPLSENHLITDSAASKPPEAESNADSSLTNENIETDLSKSVSENLNLTEQLRKILKHDESDDSINIVLKDFPDENSKD